MNLNPQQQEAVDTIEGAMVISAAPGSGKTRVVTERIKNILKHGYSPNDIVAVTFTNNAAHEMKDRLQKDLPADIVKNLTICTFHKLAMGIIRKYGYLIGREPSFSIYSENDQLDVIRGIMKDLGIKKPSAETITKRRKDPKYKVLFAEYNDQLRAVNAFDFDMLIDTAMALLTSFDKVRDEIQYKCRFLSVDEFQDANQVQYRMTKILAGKWGNVCIVGDQNQNIFSFAGSDVTLMSRFTHDYPDCKVVTIDTTYRCPSNVMDSAVSLVKHNTELIATNPVSIKKPGEMSYLVFDNGYDEAAWITSKCSAMKKEGRSLSDIAVLCRTHRVLKDIAIIMKGGGVETKICGKTRELTNTATAQDVHSYLRLLVNEYDRYSFRSVLKTPKKDIDFRTVSKIESTSRSSGMSLLDSMVHHLKEKGDVPSWAHEIIKLKDLTFVDCITSIRDKLQGFYKSKNLSTRLVELEGISNLAKTLHNKNSSITIDGYLDEVAELSSQHDATEEDTEAVKLMTVHTAKGLEWPIVFVPAVEAGTFPSGKNPDQKSMEEERRLFYVAITRAENSLFVSRARIRDVWGKERETAESPFIVESKLEN